MHESSLVSKATERNWERLNLNEKDFHKRLTKRANKRYSKKKFIPIEYLINKENISIVEEILELSQNTKSTIYSIVLNLLIKNNLIKKQDDNFITDNEILSDILKDYGQNTELNPKLLHFELPKDEIDILGIIYQSLLTEGSKNQKGSYYTPREIINKTFPKCSSDTKFLDPCCGTGSFLIVASSKIKNPENIYGYDLDENACFISKINLILKFKNKKFRPNIYNKDFLLEQTDQKFDIIATNPPWGAYTTSKHLENFNQITSGESFSYFIVKTSKHLSCNGKMSFVLPESILNVKTHKDVRRFIIDNFKINRIEILGRAFSEVLSNVVILELQKTKNNDFITIQDKNKILKLNQDFYHKNSNNNFSILDNKDVELLDKIYSYPHKKLDKKSIWGIGIVTGNNAKHISTDSKKGERIYSGKNIVKYGITNSDRFINYDRKNFQQTAPDEIYRAKEKLVYKFISKKLVFAYDNEQRLFLNSANLLIPKLEGYSIKTVLNFLNSQLFQYIYLKKFNEIKILKGNLMELPFPDNIKNKEYSDDEIFKIFKLTQKEIQYIKQQINLLD